MSGKADPSEIRAKMAERERIALRDLVRRFPTGGNQLEAALRAAYLRGIDDTIAILSSQMRANR